MITKVLITITGLLFFLMVALQVTHSAKPGFINFMFYTIIALAILTGFIDKNFKHEK